MTVAALISWLPACAQAPDGGAHPADQSVVAMYLWVDYVDFRSGDALAAWPRYFYDEIQSVAAGVKEREAVMSFAGLFAVSDKAQSPQLMEVLQGAVAVRHPSPVDFSRMDCRLLVFNPQARTVTFVSEQGLVFQTQTAVPLPAPAPTECPVLGKLSKRAMRQLKNLMGQQIAAERAKSTGSNATSAGGNGGSAAVPGDRSGAQERLPMTTPPPHHAT